MSRSLNVKVVVDEDTLWSAVMGSGWETYPWWVSTDFQGCTWESAGEDGVLYVVADDADNVDVRVDKIITFDVLQAAVEAAALHGFMDRIDWSDPDIDADLGDVIMQYAMYGDTVYS